MKGKNPQPKILSPARLSFRVEGEIESFPDNQKLREFNTPKPALQQILATSLGRKEKAITRNKKITNEKARQERQTYGKGGKSCTHKCATQTSSCEKRRGQTQDPGNAFAIKQPAT